MIRIIPLLIVFLFVISSAYPQTTLSGQLTSSDTINLKVLNVYPASFPSVSLIIRAETSNQLPIWDLSKTNILVTENSVECRVDSLVLLSQNQSVKVSLVLDHSGSMQLSDELLDTLKYPEMAQYIYDGYLYLPEGFRYPDDYIAPIDHAKSAIRVFTDSFNSTKDSINLIGFSSSVDINLPFTHDVSKIDSILNLITADSLTAFYDALKTGIHNLSHEMGLKALVALTDGQDNNSVSDFSQVVSAAQAAEVPIYIIGLGTVNKDTLKMIADSTGGRFYHTTAPTSLIGLYTLISKSIQSIYELHYTSYHLSSIDSTREIVLHYDVDSIFVNQAIVNSTLPKEVLQELRRRRDKRRMKFVYGSFLVLALIGSAVLYYKLRS